MPNDWLRRCARCKELFAPVRKDRVCPDCRASREEQVRDTVDVFRANARHFGHTG